MIGNLILARSSLENNSEFMALGHDLRRVLVLVTRGEVHRGTTVVRITQDLPEIRRPMSPRTVIRADHPGRLATGRSSGQTGYWAGPRWSLEVGQERVHIHEGQIVGLAERSGRREELKNCRSQTGNQTRYSAR